MDVSSDRFGRRRYLAGATTLAGTITTAGCLDLSTHEIYLGGLRVENGGDAARTVEIRILKDGEIVHETTVAISGMTVTDDEENVLSTVFVVCEWPTDEQGDFEVAARLAENDSWVETTSTDVQANGRCQMLFLRIEPTGTLWFSWDKCERYETENPDTVCKYATE